MLHANTVITLVEEIRSANNDFFSYETGKLIETILKAAKFELMKTEDAFTKQLGAAPGRRRRREGKQVCTEYNGHCSVVCWPALNIKQSNMHQ